jgi:ABC-type bacteriocin/lantibiotic exporter with double-glycine peptidase domain
MNSLVDIEPDEDWLYEGGKKLGTPNKKGESEVKELTPEEKEAKRIADEKASAKAKEILKSYVKKHKWLMFFGFVTNIAGMVGEFVSPLFIGWVVDAVTKRDFAEVRKIIILWMIFNTVSKNILN